MSSEEEQFEESTTCWLCEEPFDRWLRILFPVRDHDYLTGKYRGATHNKCNLNCKQNSSSLIAIFVHNFSSYDCHLIFEQLLTQASKMDYEPKIVPK